MSTKYGTDSQRGTLRTVWLLIWLVLASVRMAPIAAAEDPVAEPPKKNWSEAIKASAQEISLFADAKADKPLKMITAYKWRNPARPNVLGERLCLLYVNQGRPVASCKVYPTGRLIVHTFISFTDAPLVARKDDAIVWTPPPAAPKFVKLADADPPQVSAAGRRIQLKSIVREFSMKTGPGEAKRQAASPELRLLPQPLYRYQIVDEGQDGIIDGAAFCFVVGGGNPQALLLLEAVRAGDTMYWQYGFSRRTFAKLRAFHQKREVWTAGYLPATRQAATDAFFKLALPVAE